jgi:hypothetical protein
MSPFGDGGIQTSATVNTFASARFGRPARIKVFNGHFRAGGTVERDKNFFHNLILSGRR